MDPTLFFSNLTKHVSLQSEEIKILTAHTKQIKIKRNEYLLQEGQVSKRICFVLQGCLKIFSVHTDDSEHILDFCIEEWWAEDFYSLLTQTPSKYNIQAIEDSTLLQISHTQLEFLYKKIPKLERYFRIVFQNAYIAQREHIHQAISASAEEKYKQFLLKKPYADQRFSQKDIASYLGVTPPFFSTMKKKLKLM